MGRFGLLGKTLSHSYSPQIHRLFGSYEYHLYEKSPEEVGPFLQSGVFDGLNVTIPYKQTVIPYCARLSPEAKRIGSVNTIVREADGTLTGSNTDDAGFRYQVGRSGIAIAGAKVLVLGSGGASKTVCAVLRDLGAREVIVISRSGAEHYGNIGRHADAQVIVNTTPVGMYPNAGAAAVELAAFPACRGVLDLIYNPARTRLLLDAEARGIPHENGLAMLVAQARCSAELFLRRPLPQGETERVRKTLAASTCNWVLIGMPGCGKSTAGRALAALTGRIFADADQALVQAAGKTIEQVFAQEGEAGFRVRERAVLRMLGQRSGQVLATGGGCVTRPENYPALHQNGVLIWLQRSCDRLPTDGRPLSDGADLAQMAAVRNPLYARFADCAVAVADDPAETARRICAAVARFNEGK